MLKKYFVSFTYRKLLPAAQNEFSAPILTYQILLLQSPESEGEPTPTKVRSVSKVGIELALADLGYNAEYVNVLHMAPL